MYFIDFFTLLTVFNQFCIFFCNFIKTIWIRSYLEIHLLISCLKLIRGLMDFNTNTIVSWELEYYLFLSN
jgi:hypothetical protein